MDGQIKLEIIYFQECRVLQIKLEIMYFQELMGIMYSQECRLLQIKLEIMYFQEPMTCETLHITPAADMRCEILLITSTVLMAIGLRNPYATASE